MSRSVTQGGSCSRLSSMTPAREVRVALLPEGLLRAAVELVQQRGDRVRQIGRRKPRRVERVPRESLALQVQLAVVLAAPAVLEDLLGLVTEVAFHLENEPRRAALLVVRAPAQELPRERLHARRRLARAHRAENDGPRVQGLVPEHEPLGLADLPHLVGVMDLADHDPRLLVVGRQRPRGKPGGAGAPRADPLEPDPPHRLRHEPDHEHDHPGRDRRPRHDRPVPERRLLRDEEQETVVQRQRVEPHPPHRHGPRREQPDYHSGNPSASHTSASAAPTARFARRSSMRLPITRRRLATSSAPP